MDNVNPPPGQAPDDVSSTQPFRFTPGWPGGAEGHGPPQWHPQPPGGLGPQPPGGLGPQPRGGRGPGQGIGPGAAPGTAQRQGKRHRALRWAGGIAAVALLAAGGTLAGLRLAGGSAAPANSASAAALNGALSSPAGTANAGTGTGAGCRPAASATAAGQARARHCRRALLLRRLVRGMYGEVSFRSASGTVTLAFERGTIESASGGHLVVRAASGTTWTWTLASNPVIRSAGKKLQASALTTGSRVFVAGKVSGSTKDARLVIVRAATGGSPRKSSSQAPASSSAA